MSEKELTICDAVINQKYILSGFQNGSSGIEERLQRRLLERGFNPGSDLYVLRKVMGNYHVLVGSTEMGICNYYASNILLTEPEEKKDKKINLITYSTQQVPLSEHQSLVAKTLP